MKKIFALIIVFMLALCGCGKAEPAPTPEPTPEPFNLEQYKADASDLVGRMDTSFLAYANVASWELKFHNNRGSGYDPEYAFNEGTKWYSEQTGEQWESIVAEYESICDDYMRLVGTDIQGDYIATQIRDNMTTLYNDYNEVVSTVNGPTTSAFKSCANAMSEFTKIVDVLKTYF